MQLTALSTFGFRNLGEQRIVFPGRVTVFVGRNGQGKTSILEAISILSYGRSFRTSSFRDLVSWERSSAVPDQVRFAVSGECESDIGSFSISYHLTPERRQVSLNGNPVAAASEFFGRVKVVEFSPDDLLIVKDAPAIRRQYLDRSIAMLDRHYVTLLVQYQRALKQRNALLLSLRRRGTSEATSRELRSWAESLVKRGRQIVEKRRAFVASLQRYFGDTYYFLAAASVDRSELGTLEYRSPYLDEHGVISEERLLEQYEISVKKDLRLTTTSLGPHRDDLNLLLDTGNGPREARRFGSQGQIRSLVLALKLSTRRVIQDQTGESAILLLDDVDSELDAERKDALFKLLRDVPGQVIVTTTDSGLLRFPDLQAATLFTVSDGLVSPSQGI